MNILNIEHIWKRYGEKVIFEDASCGIQEGDKIGVIGINGTGKTTFLKMIAGEDTPDQGQIIKQNGIRMAYLSQHPEFPKGATVLSYAWEGLREEDWAAKSEVKSYLNQLGITDHEALMETLSGGQKKRVALAKTLADQFDVLLLDEPTNHLDGEMITWLEDYLKSYRGVVIMVTHDRYFLDKVTNRILEISRGAIYSYHANYSSFLELKAQREEMELASERKRQSVLRMEIEWAKRGCRARTTKQKARLERLEALKNGQAPERDSVAEIDSVETRMGKKTIELQHVSKRYDDKILLDDISYIVLKHQNLGIVGPNGCGKSTLLKMIAGLVEPDSGTIEIGETIRIGYFAQEIPEMRTKQRVIDFVKDIAEYIPTKDGRITASQMLERFLFTPEMQYGPIEKLSGGELKRLYLLSVLQAAPNVLLFDEANNDIDIPTMTILEDYLNAFQGIVITVSHDRYFLDTVVDRILEFDGEGHLVQYEGGYTDYLEAKQQKIAGKQQSVESKKAAAKQDWKQQRQQKLKFTFQEQKEYETIDDDIAQLEERIEQLDAQMMEHATNSAKLSELVGEKEKVAEQLEAKMDRWVYLNDLAERIAEQKKEQERKNG